MLTNDLNADAADGDGQPGARALVTGAKIATAALIAALALWGLPARAQPSASASVSVTITVEPIAQVEFPSGTDFIIRVPGRDRCHVPNGYRWDGHKSYHSEWDNDCWIGHGTWWWPVILPVRIPFTVTGNALASVSAAPSAFLRIPHNRYYGRAVGPHGAPLGYDVVVHFPAPERDYRWLPDWSDWDNWDDWGHWRGFGFLPHWSKYARLSGDDGAGTPPLTADMVSLHGSAYGVIYVVARRTWTPDGRPAEPGAYAGRLEVTVTADNR